MYKENERLKVGDIVKHFKRDLSDNNSVGFKYLYKILAFGIDSSTLNKLVIYSSLNDPEGDEKIWVRDYQEFMSEVDRTKYPDAKQIYRFEKIWI